MLLFFYIIIFSPESEPLKAVQGATGISESRGTWRGDRCHLPCSGHHGLEPSPSFPQARGAMLAAVLALLPQGQPLRLCPSPRGASLPGPIPVPSAQFGVTHAASWGGTCGARWDQRAAALQHPRAKAEARKGLG